jgi:uroporphyrinogen III methyltransferase/synthase
MSMSSQRPPAGLDAASTDGHGPAAGRVAFVGAGPGDPELLSLRALERLRQADVVVHDALVPPNVLALIPSQAERLAVPRDSRDDGADPGTAIGQLLARLAAAGRLVVRLKGGDPGIFGRLSEEMAPVRAAGVAVEIVPGITSAAAAAAAAGIPLTSRSNASVVTILTGHEAVDKPEAIDFRTLAATPGTLAIYMGVEQVGRWSRELIAAGKPADTPVTVVSRCGWPDERVGTSTLARCVQDFGRHAWPAPAVAIVGDVADHAADDRSGPLAGRRVLVTRPHDQGTALDATIRAAGGRCLHVPAITVGPPASWEPVDEAIRQAASFDWLVFASANGARSFAGRMRELGLDARCLGTARLAAIGTATARELAAGGLACDLVPRRSNSEGIVEAFATAAPASRFLLVRANRGRDLMRRELEARGHTVREVAAYATAPVVALDASMSAVLDRLPIDWVTVTSSLIAEATCGLFGDRLAGWRIASLSPITSESLRRHGFEPTVEARTASVESLVQAMADWETAQAARPA